MVIYPLPIFLPKFAVVSTYDFGLLNPIWLRKMRFLHLLKAHMQRSIDDGGRTRQEVRKLKAKEQLAAQIDAWVNEGGSTGIIVT